MKVLVAWLVCCASACAVEIPANIYEHTITEIQLADDEDVTFVAVKPADNEVSEVATTFGIGITCPPGRYKAIVVAIRDGKFDRSRRAVKYFDCVRGVPGPDVDPDPDKPDVPDVVPGPRPEGFAGAVFDEIVKAKLGASAMKLAQAADTVLQRLDAQTKGTGERLYNTPDVCVAAFVTETRNQQLPATWKSVLQWIANTGKNNAKTFPGVRAVLDGVRLGARRAAGEKQ